MPASISFRPCDATCLTTNRAVTAHLQVACRGASLRTTVRPTLGPTQGRVQWEQRLEPEAERYDQVM
jgi:hypothetical protein